MTMSHYHGGDAVLDGCGLMLCLFLAAVALMLCAAAVWWLA